LLSVYCLVQATQNFSRRFWAGYAVFTIALLYLHNWSWLILAGEWVTIPFVVRNAQRDDRTRLLRQWIVVQSVIAAMYAFWIPFFLYQVRHAGHSPSLIDITDDFTFALVVSARKFLEATILGYGQVHSAEGDRWGWVYALPLIAMTAAQFVFTRASDDTGSSDSERDPLRQTAMRFLLVIPLVAFVVALAASPKTELMLPRCIVSVAPLLLLALAGWLAAHRKRSLVVTGGVTLGVLLLSYLISLDRLLPTSRSNARELAQTIAARTDSSDLVVISPNWIASSFNRYYSPTVEQIDFPDFRREGAIDFSSFLDRLRDSGPLVRVAVHFATARKAQRRVWLVFEARQTRAYPPKQLLTMLNSDSYALAAAARTTQLRLALDSLYGSPDTVVVAATPIQRYEFLRALLYSPK
jgi:hypothetical protein